MGLFDKKPKFRGTSVLSFKDEEERINAAIDTFLWIKDYLVSYSLKQDKTKIKTIASYFYEIPKEMRRTGMSDYQWMDFNNMLFWLVYVTATCTKAFFFSELNQRVMARMLQGRYYSDEPVEYKKMEDITVDREYAREVIKAYDYQTSLCFNYWKYYE